MDKIQLAKVNNSVERYHNDSLEDDTWSALAMRLLAALASLASSSSNLLLSLTAWVAAHWLWIAMRSLEIRNRSGSIK